MEEDQPARVGKDFQENRAASMTCRVSKGRERLQRIKLKSTTDFQRNQRDFESHMELFKWMEEQQVVSTLARERGVQQALLKMGDIEVASSSYGLGLKEVPQLEMFLKP